MVESKVVKASGGRARKRSKRVDHCDQCGKAHRKKDGNPSCIAHKAGKPDEPCGGSPVKGMTVCTQHGGRAPQAKEKAQQRLALMEAEGEIGNLMRMCDLPEQHPIDGLLECVRVAGAMTRVLTAKVASLKEEPSILAIAYERKDGGEGTTKIAGDDALWGVNHMGDQAPHVYVSMLKSWQDAYARACKMALDAGIDERRIRLAESQTEGLYNAVQTALGQVPDLTPAQQQAFSVALAAALRAQAPIPIESAV